jgi:hypothetical protein
VEVDDVETKPEVLTEAPVSDPGLEIAVAGGEEAYLHPQGAGGAEGQDLPLLDDAQQLGLHGRGHLGDLVEEEGAAIRRGDQTGLADGAGEGAFLVAEELIAQQFLVESGAVDGQEGTLRVGAMFVDEARQHFLARPRLAGDEDIAARGSDLPRHVQ